ncbi:MAG: alpha,2-mannosyltransferase [Candidatus Sumerlaeota bacterium]|nr:alpha,2-mannosyltransferase [Candidatus Sumerlaeota bacterium]
MLTLWKNATTRERVLFVLLGGFLLVMLGRGIDSTWSYNDFEVFHYAGGAAWEKAPDMYTTESPIKSRKFVYPPSASMFLMPLAWAPYKVTSLLFTLLKIAALALLIVGVIAKSGNAPRDRATRLGLMLAAVVITLQPITSDVGNGQVNIIVGAAALLGVWLMMESRRWWWAGSLLVAIAVAIKATPLLLLAVPFLHRRWIPFAASLGMIVLLLVAMPTAWFGPELVKSYTESFKHYSNKAVEEGARRPRQVCLYEMVLFTGAQLHADDDLVWDADEGETFRVLPDGTRVKTGVKPAWPKRTGQIIWLAIGLGTGVLFLAGRWLLARRRGETIPWQWDLAMLVTLMILLAPMVRRAHLVVLLAPVGWVVVRLWWMARAHGGWRHLAVARKGLVALLTLTLMFFWASEDLAIPAPGFPIPYHPALFFAMIGLVAIIAWLGTITVSDEEQAKAE